MICLCGCGKIPILKKSKWCWGHASRGEPIDDRIFESDCDESLYFKKQKQPKIPF